MKNARWFIPSLLMAALLATGCFLISGQFIVAYDFQDVHVTSATGIEGVVVDLNTVKDYSDHKDDLRGLSDIAILGDFTNNGGSDIDVEVWMVDNAGPLITDASTVRADGVKVWGPFHLGAGATRKITWDESAALFAAGKKPLLDQIKGDGVFTLYALGPAGTSVYDFSVANGKLIAVIDAGK
jgi:hypothetical protein